MLGDERFRKLLTAEAQTFDPSGAHRGEIRRMPSPAIATGTATGVEGLGDGANAGVALRHDLSDDGS